MPLDAWLLLVVAVWLGLGLELAFFRAQRKRAYAARVSGRPEATHAGPSAPGDDGDGVGRG